MAISSPSTGPVPVMNGELIHAIAKERVAERAGTLAEVQGEIKRVTQQLFSGQLKPFDELDDVDLPLPVGGESASPSEEPVLLEGDFVAEAEAEAIALYATDVSNAVGRTDVHLIHEPEHVLGHSDGDDAYVDLHNGINADTVNHEFQHVADGQFMHAAGNLDAGIAEQVTEDLPDALAVKVDADDEALTLTARAVLEKRATVAGGSASEAYKQDFVDPFDRVSDRMEAAGIDAEAVMNRLVQSQDVKGYQDAVRTMVAYEALQLAA